MDEKIQLIDFDGQTLTHRCTEGISTHVGGTRPAFRSSWGFDPEYPLLAFAEEMESEEYFQSDPIDCSPEGVVLLGSGNEILLQDLSGKEQRWALNQKHITAFQRTIPYEIKERLMRVASTRWKLYELLAYVPSSAAVFDLNPTIATLLANAETWRPERGKNLWQSISARVDNLDPFDEISVLKWLGVLPHPDLILSMREFGNESMVFHELTALIAKYKASSSHLSRWS